jgi:hypothetical protein
MEQPIEARVVLLAAEKIRQQGQLIDGKHVLHQVSLEIGFDDYSVVISDHKVSLSLFFHNKIKADYDRVQDLEDFYAKLRQLAKYQIN